MRQKNNLRHLIKNIKKRFVDFCKKITLLDLSRFFFYAFIFTIPFQMDLVFYTSSVFFGGNFNPYTSGFIYISEIFFVISLVLWGASIISGGYKGRVTYGKAVIMLFLILFFISAETSVLFAKDQLISFFLVIRMFELLLVYFFIINDVVSIRKLIKIFIYSVLIQVVIAILQYTFQGSVGLHLLGEPSISSTIPGVAKIALQDQLLLRPYGTFVHPNVLAAYILVAIFFIYYLYRDERKKFLLAVFVLFVAALVLTFSRSAFLAIVIGSLAYFSLSNYKFSIKYLFLAVSIVVFFVVLFNLESAFLSRILFADISSLQERVFYFNISKLMMFAMPFGVGLGNFTLNMADFTNTKLAPWDFQPVHNVFMLITNEIGFIGLIFFIMILLLLTVNVFLRIKKSRGIHSDYGKILFSLIVCIFVLSLFDHYLISLYHGQVLLFVTFGFCGRYIISRTH